MAFSQSGTVDVPVCVCWGMNHMCLIFPIWELDQEANLQKDTVKEVNVYF